MPFCKYCGSAHDADAAFCTECGKPITRKSSPPKKEKIEVLPKAEPNETIRAEGVDRDYVLGYATTPEKEEQLKEYWDRIRLYTVCLLVWKPIFREHSEWLGEEEYKKIEEYLAQTYDIPHNSVFRIEELSDFLREQQDTPPATHRTNGTYTKRNKEYWSKFEKNEDDK